MTLVAVYVWPGSPLPSSTVTVTVNAPPVAYVWVAVVAELALVVVPSPKSQAYVSVELLPCATVGHTVNLHDVLSLQAVGVNHAVGPEPAANTGKIASLLVV